MITCNRSGHRFYLCDKMGVIRWKPLTYEHMSALSETRPSASGSDWVYSIDKHVFDVNLKYDYSRKKHPTEFKGNLFGLFTKSFGLPIRCFILIVFLWRNFEKK